MFATHPLYRQELCGLFEAPLDWSRLRNRCVCVTGATGLIGSALVDALMLFNREFGGNVQVLALGRSAERIAARFPEYAGDRLLTALEQDVTASLNWRGSVDFILHAASNAHPLAFARQPVETLLGNLLGTRNLLEFLRLQGHGRLLYASTGEIYGDNPTVTEGYSETDFGLVDPILPRSCYPEGKRASETLCAAYAAEYGVDSVVARLCYVYGAPISATNSRADAQFLRRAAAGEPIILKSDGAQQRSWCYLPDCLSALFTLLLSGECAQAYNVAPAAGVASIREYAQTLADAAGVPMQFDLPPEQERRGYSRVTRAVQRSDKLQALGWSARYSLAEGLSHTLTIHRDTLQNHRE